MSDKYIYIKSYGCQMNVYDSNRIKDLFSNKGYKITDDVSKADLTVLNTCHIREKAVEKVYSDICLLYTSPSPRDRTRSRMPSSA